MRRQPPYATFMVTTVLLFSNGTPSSAQVSIDDPLAALRSKYQSDRDSYLAEHPVRLSPLLKAAAELVDLTGRFDVIIIDKCEFDPDLPVWDAGTGLRMNTILELDKSYKGAMQNEMDKPQSSLGPDRSLCADAKRHRQQTVRAFQRAAAILRQQGY
jgi:hypothetical protein